MSNNIWSHVNEMFQLPFTSPVLIFNLVLFIILLAPRLMEKIKIPHIVGYILAGVLIGPYCLNLLKKNLGYKSKIIDDNILNGSIILILLPGWFHPCD